MNVFVLCAGRCGSMTFIKAAAHIANYTAGHETRAHLIGYDRLSYPRRHIEADNRLSWFLGRLNAEYGDSATYVHLMRRDQEATVRSFLKRYDSGIMLAYRRGVLMGLSENEEPILVCRDYVQTVTQNIRAFLQNKSSVVRIYLETAKDDFRDFWNAIAAEGDRDAALNEWNTRYNASEAAC